MIESTKRLYNLIKYIIERYLKAFKIADIVNKLNDIQNRSNRIDDIDKTSVLIDKQFKLVNKGCC